MRGILSRFLGLLSTESLNLEILREMNTAAEWILGWVTGRGVEGGSLFDVMTRRGTFCGPEPETSDLSSGSITSRAVRVPTI